MLDAILRDVKSKRKLLSGPMQHEKLKANAMPAVQGNRPKFHGLSLLYQNLEMWKTLPRANANISL